MNVNMDDKIEHMGILYVVATPIGNLEDITLRATKILLNTPVIACEDTRHTGQLIKILERGPLSKRGPLSVRAAITALSAAGLPTNKFLFLGFLPKKWEIREEETTIIYESPIRIEKTVSEIKSRYPDAQIVLAHELTKIHEKIWHLKFDDFGLQIPHKGEFVILVYRSKDSAQSYPPDY